jgi:hypothetical protein
MCRKIGRRGDGLVHPPPAFIGTHQLISDLPGLSLVTLAPPLKLSLRAAIAGSTVQDSGT